MKNLLYIGNQLSQKGKTVSTIETLSASLVGEGYTVYIASAKKNKILRLLDMLYHVFKYRNSVDFVLIDTYSTLNFYFAYLVSLFCRLLNLEYVPILHGGNLPDRLKNSSKLCKKIFSNSFKNVSPSLYLLSKFKDFGYYNLVYIPNSINLENYFFNNREYKTVRLLWVRSFSNIYNPNLAIDILKKLQDKDIQTSLCMVGPENDGALEKAKTYAKQLKVEVNFTGKLSKSEWIELSKDYNIFINTTNFDNMPVSVIEAMALGLPVISTNVGGMPFLIDDGKDGVLVEPNNVDQFVKAVKRLKNNQMDTNQMALNARKKVEQFDWEVVKEKWFKVMQ